MRAVAPGMTVIALLALGGPIHRERPARARTFDAPDAAARYERGRRAPLDARLDVAAAYDRAAAQRLAMPRFSSRLGRTLPAAIAPASIWTAGSHVVALNGAVSPTALLDAWAPLGPGNIGGRTRVIRYHPTRHTTLFAAGVSGGVWRSDDDGTSWRPIADGLENVTVNALAIDPRTPDTIYAGTGEGYFREEIRGTGLPLRGSGIFVTRDGGVSWRRLASTASDDFLWVNDLEFGVGDSRRLYAATRTGVWRSIDAGEHWTQLLATTVRGGCLDLAIRPDQPDDTLFASCGSYDQGTVYRFAHAAGGLNLEVVLREPAMGRTSLAIAPSRPETIYALAASNDPGPDGNFEQGLLAVYRSDSGGAPGSWQPRVTNTSATRLDTLLLTNVGAASIQECSNGQQPNDFINMGWYNNVIAVDPRDPERVWAAGVDWFRSDDGGRTWGIASSQAGNPRTLAAYAHVDQHAMTFHPDYDGQGNQTVLIGNDGGVFRTANARARTSSGPRAGCANAGVPTIEVRWESLNHDYGVTQFYHGVPFPDGTRYIGGAQDNGTPLGSDDAGSNGWQSLFGGDGGYVAVNPANPQILFAESQWANIGRSLNGGATFSDGTRGLDEIRSSTLGPDANYLFVAPFVMDPANANRLWVGGEYLYRTSDAAANWTKASDAMPDGGLVSTIAIGAGDANHVIAGTHKGDIVSTKSALAALPTTWTSTRPRDGWVTSVAFDPRSANTIYATYGNFGGTHVYQSGDGGATWSRLDGWGSGALPDIPTHSIVVDPDDGSRLYLGTDLGVFVSIDRGATWMAEETGFGPVVTEWLVIQRDTAGRKRLYAFTHGRGVWRVELR